MTPVDPCLKVEYSTIECQIANERFLDGFRRETKPNASFLFPVLIFFFALKSAHEAGVACDALLRTMPYPVRKYDDWFPKLV